MTIIASGAATCEEAFVEFNLVFDFGLAVFVTGRVGLQKGVDLHAAREAQHAPHLGLG